MSVFLFILAVLCYLFLLLLLAAQPQPSDASRFELRRRAKQNDLAARRTLEREEKLHDVSTLFVLVANILLVVVVILLVSGLGWFFGGLLALIAGMSVPRLSHSRPIQKHAKRLYARYEPGILHRIDVLVPFFKVFRTAKAGGVDRHRRFDSREELQFTIRQSDSVLTAEERSLMIAALDFKDQQVEKVMTPRNVMTTIHKDEFLGPLVLSELHDSGHSRLPVIGEDVDHIVGMLHVRDLLSLDEKQSNTAEAKMEKKVFYIHQDDTLDHALAAFLKTRHHLFIVINDQRETVGLLSLEDVIEALIGRKIVDEDDNHADLRAVALRKGKTNNAGEGHVNI